MLREFDYRVSYFLLGQRGKGSGECWGVLTAQ
jgi:hypothetical protein